jgi:DNA-directed RNA polymerase specialized sigma24 family protein
MDPHLSQLSTAWTMLAQAHDDNTPLEVMRAARRQLLERYEPVVRQYLRGLLRGRPDRDDAVEECVQNFALRFVSGGFRGADRSRGRFRDYLKAAVRNLALSYQRTGRVQVLHLDDYEPPVEDPSLHESDREFLTIWRDDLLARTLKALAAEDERGGQHLYTVLRFRMDHTELRSHEMAEQLAARVGKPVNAGWVRKRLFLARERFAELLLDEVLQSPDGPGEDRLEQELIELGLHDYCRSALAQRRGRA